MLFPEEDVQFHLHNPFFPPFFSKRLINVLKYKAILQTALIFQMSQTEAVTNNTIHHVFPYSVCEISGE